MNDKNGVTIELGQIVKTNEAMWVGVVVKIGDHFCIDVERYGNAAYHYPADHLVLVDFDGGYSIEPEWGKCEVTKAHRVKVPITKCTLAKYLLGCAERNVIDFAIRATPIGDGKSVKFYIHPANESGETLDFIVSGNELTTEQDPREIQF